MFRKSALMLFLVNSAVNATSIPFGGILYILHLEEFLTSRIFRC